MTGWRPTATLDAVRRRARMLERAHRYFAERGVLVVDTPVLGHATVTDPNVDSLRCEDGRYLQTSPEFFMKRLLAAGFPDIYSIGPVFRGNERGGQHLSQFTLIEWYRHDFGLDAIIDDTTTLIATLLNREDVHTNIERHDYVTLFESVTGTHPLDAPIDDLRRAANADPDLTDALGARRDAWLDLLMATRVAPALSKDCLTIVQHFPASQGALARRCPLDVRVADRFEVFYGATELANGYVELIDAEEQVARMSADLRTRAAIGKSPVEPDRRMLDALRAGLPRCAGVALGVERVQMVADSATDIREVVTFVEEADDD